MENLTEQENKNRERFVRWQNNLITQSSSLNNFLSTISIGIIGGIIVMFHNGFYPPCYPKFLFLIGILSCLLSASFGLVGNISRLIDFRLTLKKIKSEIENKSQEELDSIVKLYRIYGDRTWTSLYVQVVLFIIGISALSIAFIITYNKMLF